MHTGPKLMPTVAGALLAAGAVTLPAAAQTVVKVGVINTFSGPTAAQGQVLEQGLQLYYKLHQKDLPRGVKIQLIERDDTGLAPDVAKRLAQELVTRDHVQILTGFVWSPNFLAMGPLANQAKIPVISLNAAATEAVAESPYMVRFSFTLPQQAYPLGLWASKQYKTAFTAVSDYAPGHEGADAFVKGFTAGGGKMVGSVVIPPPPATPNFAPFMQRAKDAHPQAVYIFVPAGPQATQIMKVSHDLGLQQSGAHLVSTEDLVPDEQLPNMGDQPIGLITSGIYSADATRPANQAFVRAWYKEYGTKTKPDFESASAWDGMHAIFALVEKTKGHFTGPEAMAFLSHWKDPNSPKGPILIDPKTRQIIENVYLRRVEKKDGHLVDVEFQSFGLIGPEGLPYHPGASDK